MKRTKLLLIIFAFTGLNIFCQTYYPIVQENKEWDVMQVIFPGTSNDSTYWTVKYKINGDTVINNINYKKVYMSEELIPTNWSLDGYIREDSTRKVFYNFYGVDLLKYDFGAELGDTINVYNNNYPTSLLVSSIDSIFVNDGFRKRLILSYIDYYPYYETWIEGIGSDRGLLSSGTAPYVGGRTWFLCMSMNGELIYMNPYYNTCYLINTDIEEFNNTRIELYPNPATDELFIRNSNKLEIITISIIDMAGNKIKEFFGNKTKISISEFEGGLYVLQLNHKDGILSRKIIIK